MTNTMYKNRQFIMKTISYLISQQIIHPRVLLWQITVCVLVAIKLIYPDHNVSYSKKTKYNFDNTIIIEALSHRFSVPTSQEYICKKCDKDLLDEIMPMNSVASRIWLTSNEPQKKYIHCNTLCTEKFLIFNKAKYGQNAIVSQMIQHDTQDIICNKCHNAICRESLVTCLYVQKLWKNYTLKLDTNKYSSLETNIQENSQITENKLLHMQKLPCRIATKNDMCVL